MLRTHRARESPGGCVGGWGFGSVEQKGPRRAPLLWPQRVGDHTWDPSSSLSLSEHGKCPLLLSCSQRAPPTSLSCSLPAFLLHPQDQPSPEGTSAGIGPSPRARQTSPAHWAGEMLGMLPPDPSPWGSLQAWEPHPLLATPQGWQSCPASSYPPPSVPPSPTSSLGGSSHFLGHWVPPPESSSCPSCGEMWTSCLPTLPSWLCPHPPVFLLLLVLFIYLYIRVVWINQWLRKSYSNTKG